MSMEVCVMHFASMAVREMIQHQNSMRLNKREREREKVDECSRKRRRERYIPWKCSSQEMN